MSLAVCLSLVFARATGSACLCPSFPRRAGSFGSRLRQDWCGGRPGIFWLRPGAIGRASGRFPSRGAHHGRWDDAPGQASCDKDTADAALASVPDVRSVLVISNDGSDVGILKGKDHRWEDIGQDMSVRVQTEMMDPNDPFISSTRSGNDGSAERDRSFARWLSDQAGYRLWLRIRHSKG